MARSRIGSQDGFTLVEVMVAISVLLIGVLGTVTMIDTGNATTLRTEGRQGGTALARSILEIARSIPYRELTSARLLAELDAREGLDDALPGVSGHQISSNGFDYTVLPLVCVTDDPIDGLGDQDEESFCENSASLPPGGSAADRNADDYRRVVVELEWNVASAPLDTVLQTAIVTNPVGGLGPSVTSLTPDVPSTTEVFSEGVATASYDLTTSSVPASVTWSVDGARLGQATGSGTSWSFDWPLGAADEPTFVDCVYVVQAEAFDDKGRAGAAKALTITLNRRDPFPPSHFDGGRNLNAARVDLQWDPNRECDVTGYRVYRGSDPEAIGTEVCETDRAEPTTCVDETAPSDATLYYQVVAIDTPPGGGEREGDRSDVLVVPAETENAGPPPAPAALTVCTGGAAGCTDIDGEPAPTDLPVLSWDESADPDGISFYRVYRDGMTYADRLDVLFKVPDKPLVFIDATAHGAHTYSVSAVDGLFGESALTGPVSWP
jgi:prepilin-type N-terminal cleavage/methylation domain-containing protein